jgi:peptidoglycan/xylan/chitin deacetylase (PgdA/CDA1 family)
VSSFATESRALQRARPVRYRARNAARRAVLTALSAVPRERRAGVRIVHYHYVFDDEHESFERQMRFLAREFMPVSLSEAVERLRTGRSDGDELVVTFDDGFRNQLTNAAPLLAELGISACFYLVTDLLSASPEEAQWFCRERLHLPVPVKPLDWDSAENLLDLGHEIGSHTRSHRVLTALPRAELDAELRGSRAELSQRLGPVRHLSVPYGERSRFSERVADAAREAGYESCATAMRGRNRAAEDLYALRRDHLEAGWPLRDLAYFLG